MRRQRAPWLGLGYDLPSDESRVTASPFVNAVRTGAAGGAAFVELGLGVTFGVLPR